MAGTPRPGRSSDSSPAGAGREPRPAQILAIADRPGWVIDHKALNLRRVLQGKYEVLERFQADVSEADITSADIVVVFYWLQILKLPVSEAVLAQRCDRLLIGKLEASSIERSSH